MYIFIEVYIMDFMDLKLHLWLISKKFKKKTEKQSREIYTCNSLDGRFDKDFYYGFIDNGG